MSEEEQNGAEAEGDKGARQRMGDGIRSGIGVLSAFKDALEETIREARERGDLSTERAKELMKDALEKAQTAASGAKERLDFVTHSELEDLQAAVEALNQRVVALEARVVEAERDAEDPAEEES